MDAFVKDPSNKYNLVPVLLSAQEGEKGGPLTSYNEIFIRACTCYSELKYK